MRALCGGALIAALALVPASLPIAFSAAAQSPAAAQRYASLRHPSVHVRAGPGEEYPIRWTYKRPGLPVLVLRDHDHWRQVRDSEGEEGWIHKIGLTGKRMVQIVGGIRVLRRAPEDGSDAVARLEPGVLGKIEKCERGWCRVHVQAYRGWVRQVDVWGVQPGERVE